MTALEIEAACRVLLERGTKPTILEVGPITEAFDRLPGNESGGSLHIVLEDGNVENSSVEFCIRYAVTAGDTTGELLGRVLLLMSQTQRRKL